MMHIRTPRGGAVLLAACLVAPRLLVPMGYMPGTDAQGRPALVFCDDEARAAFAGHPEHHAHHHVTGAEHGGPQPRPGHEHHATYSCPFGIGVGPPALAAPVLTVAFRVDWLPASPPAAVPVDRAPSVAANGPRAPPSA
jgi:Protein of unknown function (DUF2946)